MSLRPPLAFIPAETGTIPASVSRMAGDQDSEAVWINQAGGTTYRIGAGTATDRYLKYAPRGTADPDFAAEALRLRWASEHARVPEVIQVGSDESGSWLLTAALPGESAVSGTWMKRPELAARALGAGLRKLHESLPVQDCPFEWSVGERLRAFEQRIAAGEGPENWSGDCVHLGIGEARELLSNPPLPLDLVVCHGDACAPNTLLDGHGNFYAHVDLGELGVADRWADLAVAAWSTAWNYGSGYEDHVYAGYGIEPDATRIGYYRMLWDLS
ncbi:aminoglycoside 3'-phosphotransferase [Paeniglutamicibacter psychrophenolicus]|uniref:Kanamycin kinase n=1 Tax=Paeniglutamicibacter psychrophenolicus TaxID=257454 RepID=A0ABS4WH38_9MICC|nr:aminoglycoside 3'-phosphotransferase [Paeniglutamicibacter psychrophenolicus]MBP2375522.1 kanamycin kinase [Paeniglutamicibacter psychrophenolicus]